MKKGFRKEFIMQIIGQAKTLHAESIKKLDEQAIKFIKEKPNEFEKAKNGNRHYRDVHMQSQVSAITKIDKQFYYVVNYQVIESSAVADEKNYGRYGGF